MAARFPRAAALAGGLLLAAGGAACGRALPEDTPASTRPAETGVFDEPQPAGEGSVTGVGPGDG